jgi:hypothetical protein
MSLQYSPKIVQDSLVMCLDPSQNKSYPTDLPVKNGLVMWMDAADDTTFSYSSGTTVSQWRDKSGLNNHMVPVSAGPTRNAFLNSRKVLAFTTTQQIRNTTLSLINSANTVFVICRYTNPSSGKERILTSDESANNWLLGNYGNGINRYYANGWVNLSYDTVDTAWRISMGDWSGPSTDLANFYSNGTAGNTNNSGASQGPASLGINRYYGETSNCEVSEIIVFDRVLSATERKQVHTYLGQKWGISNTDRSIVDLSNNNNNGLFGNGTVANMPDYDFYNKGAFKFNGSSDEVNFGDVIKFTSTQDFTLEVWVNYLPNATSYVPLLSKEDSPGFGYALKVDETYGYQPYLVITGTTSAYRYANVNINDGVWHHIVGVAKASSTTIDMYVDGVLINGVASLLSWAGTATTNALRLGKNYGSAFFKGNLSNSKIYNKALSATEISQNYEAQKSKFANTIVQQGLVLNLDAGNPYSYAGAGTVWYDVSGNSYNGTLIGSPVYTSNNNGGIIFDSVAKYVTLPASGLAFGTGQFAIEAWVFSTAAVSYNHVYSSQSSNNVGFISLYYQNGYGFSVADLGNSAVRTVTTHQTVVSQNTWYHVVGIRNASNQYIVYVNGVESTTNSTSSYPLTATAPQIASNPASNTERFTGTIASFRLYNTSLSAAQVLQNYNATKGRFGL